MRRAALLALCLAACSRTSLSVDRDAGPLTPPPPPRVDAGTDAGPPPIPIEGCAVGPILGPYVQDAPAFAFSLVPMEDGFLVAYAHGWPPDERPALATLDRALGGFRERASLPGHQASAAVSGGSAVALAAVDPRDRLELVRLGVGPGVWASGPPETICETCFAPWVGAAPAFEGGVVTFAYRDDGGVTAYSDLGAGAMPLVRTFPGESEPIVTALPTGGYALATFPGRAGETGAIVRWLGRDLETRARADVPLVSVGSAPGLLARDDDVLLVGRADADGAMHVVRAAEDVLVETTPLPIDETLVLGVDAAESRGVVAITLESLRRTFVVALRSDTLEPVMDPVALVDDARGSYRRPTTVAPHPDGFAIIYGGWHREGNYGLYGRLMTCRGFE